MTFKKLRVWLNLLVFVWLSAEEFLTETCMHLECQVKRFKTTETPTTTVIGASLTNLYH